MFGNSKMIEITNKFWEEIYHQNIKKMIGICYRYTYDSKLAEDLAHDAFALAYEKAASFKGTGPFEAWLRRIVVNVCLQHIREKSKEKYVNDSLSNEALTMESNDENSANGKNDFSHEELLAAINQLPEHHKLVFNLWVIDRFTHAQIGKELGISEGTSKSHLARARKKIKQLLIEKLKSEKGDRSASSRLFGFPIKLWNIDGLYRTQFKNFEIENLTPYSLDPFSGSPVQIPSIKVPFLAHYLYPAIITLAVGTCLVTYLNFRENDTVYENESFNATKNAKLKKRDKTSTKDPDLTATIITNSNIVREDGSLTNPNDTMKNSRALAALLLASSMLTNSSGQTTIVDTGFNPKNKEVYTSHLPNTIVRDITKVRNGNILIASSGGVFRYDGKSFTNLTSKVGSPSFTDVLEDRRGNLWFASSDSGVYHYDGKFFQHFTSREGLGGNSVWCMYEDTAGNIWFGCEGRASRYDGKSFQNFTVETFQADRNIIDAVLSINEDNSGKLWFGTGGAASTFDGKMFTVLKNKDGITFPFVRSIIKDKKGNIWLGSSIGLWRYDGNSFTKFPQYNVGRVYEDKKGNVWTMGANLNGRWALSRSDVRSLPDKKPTVIELNMQLGMSPYGILEADDGSIWFGALDGMYRYDGNAVTKF